MLHRQSSREGHEVARTPLAQDIQRAYDEVAERRTTRRDLLRRTAAAGAAVAGASTIGRFAKAAYGADQPKIAVVGAGLAGLTCAYRLKQAGLTAQVYAGTFIGESGTAISFFAVAVPGSPVTSLIASPVYIREQQ